VPFAVRGVVEGFYGTPWSHDARLELLEFLGQQGMNAYAYAPKDDAKHRAQWRVSYSDDELARFEALATRARDGGVRFGFAVSPGLDITYEAREDRAILLEKLLALSGTGVTWFLLLLDDIPMQPGLGPRHAELASFLLDAMRARVPDGMLTICPTEYVGTRASPYLDALAAGLPPDVDVMWTGPTVCSPTITAADARARAAALGGRAPLLWDNYPVNDGPMAACLHLGPYRGRDAELAGVLRGVLCNPMTQPRASKLALATAAEFFRRPDTYDADEASERALVTAAGERADALGWLAAACSDSPLYEPAELELARRVRELEGALDSDRWIEPARATAGLLRRARELPDVFPTDGDALASEVAPWAAAARTEAAVGLAALRLLQQVRPVAEVVDGRMRAAAPEPQHAMEHAFGLLHAWSRARTTEHVVFGPRFVVYPAVVQQPDGSLALDVDLALRADENAIDRLCRVALAAYDTWRAAPAAELEIVADRTEDVRVVAGRWATRLDGPLPFRDRRLA
jgi:hyaluronoglucosaminidase